MGAGWRRGRASGRRARRHAERPAGQQINFRVGINPGDVIEDRGDIYGGGVNVAARLESLAPPGGICVSDVVRTAMVARLALRHVFLGEQRVKNIDEPVRAYHVVVPGVEHAPMDAAPQLPPATSIAVLAFQNMSNDAEQTYFSDGVAEDIITDRSRIPGLFVVARKSSIAYRGRDVDLKAVDREHGVHTALDSNPQFSLAHRGKVLPFKDSRYLDRLEQGLRKAGPTT